MTNADGVATEHVEYLPFGEPWVREQGRGAAVPGLEEAYLFMGRRGWRSGVSGTTVMTMQPLKARVRNGRLVLDEPTDLPDGEIVELVPVNEQLAHDHDDLDDEERERLHDSLRESIRQMEAGELIDGADALAELRAHR